MNEKEFKVTPYEVKGTVDYNKLIEQFGIKRLDSKILNKIKEITKKDSHYLRREIYFAHRDLKWALDEYEKGNKFFLYTGCGPSGPVHLGHVIGIWEFVKWLQETFDVELWFQFTDDEKFLYKDKSYEEIQKWTYENMLDVIAMDFDPKKTHFLIDTKHAGIMYPEAIKVAKKITFSTIKAAFGFTDSNNIGSIFYTAMQTVPVFLPNVLNKTNKPCLIPLGFDQDPHFRISRDVIEKLGHQKPAIMHAKMMPAITGIDEKMSSTDHEKAILMTDSPKVVKNKINKYAFSGGRDTIEEHRKFGGNPDIDVAYQWLIYLEENDEKLKQIHDDYKSGKLLSGELKQILIDKINNYLTKHQERRSKITQKDIDKFIYKI
ncbi:MAG TPA: tryptophan--tRNA ligase [Nanoarchaeota archaeon]|nr:tryptophan--tRNA ligase [Nanoarchaeota archaeon]HIJ10072.1 tryptophan--tRNA ligase [Nanoarchaeota archaeon]